MGRSLLGELIRKDITNNNKDNNHIDNRSAAVSVKLNKEDQYVMDKLFSKINIVKVFIKSIVDKKVFIIGHIKRVMNKYIHSININNNKNTPLSVNKPNGLSVRGMYYANPNLFGYGTYLFG